MNLTAVHVAEALATSLSAEGHAECGRVGDNTRSSRARQGATQRPEATGTGYWPV